MNLTEPGTIELGRVLLESGIGIEAGVFSVSDADALLRAAWADRLHRLLVEVTFEHDDARAVSLGRRARPTASVWRCSRQLAVVDAEIAMEIGVRRFGGHAV